MTRCRAVDTVDELGPGQVRTARPPPACPGTARQARGALLIGVGGDDQRRE